MRKLRKQVVAFGMAIVLAGLLAPGVFGSRVLASNNGTGSCVSDLMRDKPNWIPGMPWGLFVKMYCGIPDQ